MILTSIFRVILSRSFKPFIFQGKPNEPMADYNVPQLGAYVHIPFCEKICSFCPYNKVLYEKELADVYVNALLKEIDLVGQKQTQKKEITSIYFGGGTPALVVEKLEVIINKIKLYFSIQDGVAIELHPDNINEKLLEQLKKAGVDMISVGVQSFDEGCLKKLGRAPDHVSDKIKMVKSYNFRVIDVDLIFGIPSQTKKTLMADFNHAFECGATQISTYPFIDFSYANNAHKPINGIKKKKMLDCLVKNAEEMGVQRTSVWTFAKKGTKQYSSVTRENFLGFGAGATTLLKDQFKINTFVVEAYIKATQDNKMPTALVLDFTPKQRQLYWLFWSAYNMFLHEASFEKLFEKKLNKEFGIEIALSKLLGLLKKIDGGYVLTHRGAYLFHFIEQTYTTAYIDKMWRIARNQSYPNKVVLR